MAKLNDSEGEAAETQVWLKFAVKCDYELEHSRQCEKFGGMSNFGYRYFKEFKKANQNYENNLLEREAREVADRFARYLASLPKVYFSPPYLADYHATYPMFDAQYYLTNNSDIANPCSTASDRNECARQHYLANGLKECRNASRYFHPRWYLDNNPDVKRVFKDCRGASEHWSDAGRKEGRSGAPGVSAP